VAAGWRESGLIIDTGIARFYHPAENLPGTIPSRDGVMFHAGWYGERTVGLTRFYTAKQQNDRVDTVMRILREGKWAEIGADDYCVLSDGFRYRVLQIQKVRDEDAGEDVLDISLERTGEKDVGTDYS
jgi:hypothetical protein